MFNYDDFEEKAGHKITLVQGLHAGVSTYYCENCGALVQVGQNSVENDALILFHLPHGSLSTKDKCVPGPTQEPNPRYYTTLREKLKKLEQESYDRLKASV